MNSPRRPEDHSARQEALDPGQSFAVSAPAGSGKTGLLTCRLLKLLLTVNSPEQVLAITFTNKAASEMQERVLHALQDARHGPMPEQDFQKSLWQTARAVLERDRELNWQLLKNPNRLKILTIDGLSRSIVSQLPVDSKLGGAPENLDDPDSAYREAAQNLLAEMEGDSDIAEALSELSMHMDNQLEKLADLLVSLLHKREQWLPLIMSVSGDSARHQLEASLKKVIEDHLQRLSELFLPVRPELILLLDGIGHYLSETDPEHPFAAFDGITDLPPCTADQLKLWQSIGQVFLTGKGEYRLKQDKRTGFPPGKEGKVQKDRYQQVLSSLQECSPEALSALRELTTLPASAYTDGEWRILDTLAQILPRLVAQLWVVFAAKGASDFTEIALAALQALGDEDRISDILLKLDHQIRHILVDEFQDTSLPQFELLEKLTTGWEPGDGRTLFLVGDGMQSCYGFRNANVGLFLKARQQGVGHLPLKPLNLTVNFRSQAGIVNWVNQTFSSAFPARDDISRGAVRYTPSTAFRPQEDGPAVTTYVCPYDKDQIRRELARQQEAETVVDLIAEARKSQPEASIAVLARNRSHLQQVMEELNRRRLTFVAQDMESLADRMVIGDLLTLTKVMLQPDNRLAWLALLRTPWVGLDHVDLCTLVGDADSSASDRDIRGFAFIWQNLQNDDILARLSPAGQAACRRLVNTLRDSFAQAGRKRLSGWVYGTWLSLGGPACLLRDSDHRDAEQYFNLLRAHEYAGRIQDWTGFIRAIEKLYSAPAPGADSHIQLMTLHKSKGLEFDLVFIVGIDRSSKSDDKQLLLWRERLDRQGQAHLLLSPVAPAGNDQGPVYQHLKYEQKLQGEYELTRLFYVGCTRAIRKLYLTGCLAVKEIAPEQDLAAEASPQGLLKQLWPQLKSSLCILPPPRPRQATASGKRPAGSYIRRLSARWQRPPLADNDRLAHLRLEAPEAENERNLPERESPQARQLRLTGSLVHRVFEHLSRSELPADAAQYCAGRQGAWRAQLLADGVPLQQLEPCLTTAREAVTNALTTRLGRWILNPTHDRSQAEVEILSKTTGGIRRHIIDRLFYDKGSLWIIDYKTARPEPAESTTAFILRLKEEYRPQLERYRSLFPGTRPIQCAIYNPLLAEEEALILY